MKCKNSHLSKILDFIGENLLFLLIQSIIVFALGIIEFIGWLVFGWIFYAIVQDLISANALFNIDYGISYGLIAALFAYSWLRIWRQNKKYGLRWFKAKIVFAEIPLFIAGYFIRKTPDPTAMIPYHPEPIFSLLVTAIILFPIYSILIKKFILEKSKSYKKSFIYICIFMLILGLTIFLLSWNVMHLIYHF